MVDGGRKGEMDVFVLSRHQNADFFILAGKIWCKKKACPKKSRPLLTYEKHQFQISYINRSKIKLIGKRAKNKGISGLPSYLNIGRRCCILSCLRSINSLCTEAPNCFSDRKNKFTLSCGRTLENCTLYFFRTSRIFSSVTSGSSLFPTASILTFLI